MAETFETGSSKPGFGYALYHLAWQAADWLYPPHCAGCGKIGTRWCPQCADQVRLIAPPYCPTCGAPIRPGETCPECKAHPAQFDRLRSWASFEGPVREALHHLKYKRDLGLAEVFTQPLIEIIAREGWNFDSVIPIPLSKTHYQERGYNQAREIALPVALIMKKEFIPSAVSRVKETSSQITLTAHQRYANLQDAFWANPAKLKGRNVLLIDDVATTGATLNSCARTLREAGAKTIYCLTVAKTLRKRGGASATS